MLRTAVLEKIKSSLFVCRAFLESSSFAERRRIEFTPRPRSDQGVHLFNEDLWSTIGRGGDAPPYHVPGQCLFVLMIDC
jgi:hypothetical protein